ncbi:MAG: ribosomal protein S18-alanine N-acetyltransferase [Holosporaceae bacterium]|jgi:ribosomal-protein-alanine N-acetyltransferase|nr:ribosomal protein S18-alanine N-acetyltransferase [Holosporaceae bacterium]
MINELSANDAETISQIHQSCFADGWSKDFFLDALSNKIFFGFLSKDDKADKADKADFAHGFILGKIVLEEIEIITFCVLPQFQNEGVGKSLLGSIDNYAKDHVVRQIFLEVSEDNLIARRLYEKFGYQKISERKNYYQTQNHCATAIVMVKNITF